MNVISKKVNFYVHYRARHKGNLKPKNYVKKRKRKKERKLIWKKHSSKQQNGRKLLIKQKLTYTIRTKE